MALHPAPARRGHDDPPHDALPRGGRGALRGDRADPRRAPAGARQRRRPAQRLRGADPGRRLRQGDGALSRLHDLTRGEGAALASGERPALLVRRRGLIALATRESHRVTKLWTQTIIAPVLSSFLFILVFGLSLGERITAI